MTDITLPHNFTARSYQEDFFSYMNKGGRRAVLVWSRRSGKDTSAWNFMIYSAIERRGIYYYIFPTFAQGRKVLWDGMNDIGFKFLDYIPKALIRRMNNQEMKITLINGSLIQVVGSDNYDSIRGTNPVGCIFSEYAEQDPNIWPLIVSPILDAESNKGWAIFVFTPKGTNHAKSLFDKAKENPTWYCSWLTCKETNSITDEKLAEIRAEGHMSEDMIQQEHFCSFTLGIQGSYYATYLQEMKDSGRITKVPHDKTQRVCTAWDLGWSDQTSILFFQVCGKEVHFIDCHEDRGKTTGDYARVLQSKPYVYDRHFVPHDADAHEMSMGLSTREVASNLGLQMTVLPTLKLSLEEGIECTRSLFPRFWIDEKACLHVIKALENYRCEYDEKRETYKPKPVHDKWSHMADAVRYASIAVRKFLDTDGEKITDSDSDNLWERHNPRFS
jgi:hypothetical protein